MTDNEMSKVATKPRARAPKTTAVMPPPAPPQPAAKSASKSDTVIKLLLRAKGATPVELIAATDWQPHSLRAFLSGLRKKGREVIREERKGGGYAYRIVADKAGTPTAAVAGPRLEAAPTDAVGSDASGEALASGHDASDSEDA